MSSWQARILLHLAQPVCVTRLYALGPAAGIGSAKSALHPWIPPKGEIIDHFFALSLLPNLVPFPFRASQRLLFVSRAPLSDPAELRTSPRADLHGVA